MFVRDCREGVNAQEGFSEGLFVFAKEGDIVRIAREEFRRGRGGMKGG